MHLCGIRAEVLLGTGDKRCDDTEYQDTIVLFPNNVLHAVTFVTTIALRSMSLASE